MIVVTGGAGFIGSNIVRSLNRKGFKNILIVDNLNNGEKFTNLIDLDIFDYIEKEKFMKNLLEERENFSISVIFHEGANSSTLEENGEKLMQENYQYSKKLLLFCIKKSIPFLYASSASVYGNQKSFVEIKKNEKPISLYGYTKFLFDQYVRYSLPKARSQICGLRYFNVYGPHESHKDNMSSLILQFYRQINSDQNIKIFVGSEKIKRDFIHVHDVAEINIWCWENNISGIFNCGIGKSKSILSLANEVISFLKRGKIEYISFPESLKSKYQTYTKANLSNLRKVGYNKSFKNIDQGMKEYLNWLEINGIR